jgi:hypothetical protein
MTSWGGPAQRGARHDIMGQLKTAKQGARHDIMGRLSTAWRKASGVSTAEQGATEQGERGPMQQQHLQALGACC